MIEILEKVELETVEPKVVFPQLFECRSSGPVAVFADGCGLWANGDESRLRLSTFKGDRKLKGLKLQITAGDGTEWPRVVKCRTHGTLYLWISPLKAVALQSIDVGFSHRAGEVMADESVTVHNTKPLPPGTRTILTLREGEVECEIQEPVDWLPVTRKFMRESTIKAYRRSDGELEILFPYMNCAVSGLDADWLIEQVQRFRDERRA